MENDTSTGGEPLAIDEAGKVLGKAEALEKEHAEAGDEATSGDRPRETGEETPLEHDPERPVEAEPDAGSESEDDDEDEAEADDELVADDGKVRLDDGSLVSIAELKKGHLRQADYTKKTQALVEIRIAP